MADEETPGTGEPSSAPSLYDVVASVPFPDSILRNPVEFHQRLIARLQATLKSLIASHEEFERYVNGLHKVLPPVDLQALQFAAFSTEAAGFPQPGEATIQLTATGAVNKKTSATATPFLNAWSSLSDPKERPHKPEEGRENGTRCSGCKSSVSEGTSHEKHFTHRDLRIDDGRISSQAGADGEGEKFGNIISSSMLFYRLHRMYFASTHWNPGLVVLKHRDKSLVEIRFEQWSRPEIEFLGTAAAASDLCELLTFLCGPSWHDYAGGYDLDKSIQKLHRRFPSPVRKHSGGRQH